MKTAIQQTTALFIVIILFITGCKKDDKPSDKQYTIARQELDISYGADPAQKYDVYFPEGYDAGTPVVFVIHGGGFIAGNKEGFTNVATLFAQRGYITVNINHRLVDASGIDQVPIVHKTSAIKVQDQVNDMAAAVESYKQKSTGWGTGTAKMYMAGHSAGATLAMLYVQGSKNTNGQVRASGNFGGLTTLTVPDAFYTTPPAHEYWPALKELIYRLTGAELTKENALYLMAISPDWVSTANPPGRPNITVMPVSNDDDLNFAPFFSTVNESEKYHNQLRGRNVRSERIMMDTDHGFGNHPDDWRKAVDHAVNFFRKVN
jgi:acetyl esterase/lipase